MKIISHTSHSDIANVYICEFNAGEIIECVESIQPPIPQEKKWVFIISVMFGCPSKCLICDAGGYYKGNLTKEQIKAQIRFLISTKYSDNYVPVNKFKIQFSRMGEPALNMAVLDVLSEFPDDFVAPGFIPSLSTIAPASSSKFFENLLSIKKEMYNETFQLQFSIHTTDLELRNKIMPISKLSFSEIVKYSEKFYDEKGKKITLNFALSDSLPLDINTIRNYFPTEIFLIKLTPINPTNTSISNKLYNGNLSLTQFQKTAEFINSFGYETLISIGELEENKIGSNCGQYIQNYLKSQKKLNNAYTYSIESVD